MSKVYLDACAAIFFVERHPQHFDLLMQRLFLPSGALAVQVVLSELLRMECRLKPLRENDQPLLERYDAFFGTAGHLWAALDRGVFDLATRLRAEHRLKTPDALHLAAALQSGCDELWTHDSRLQAAAQGRLTVMTFEGVAP
jgi:predicted nucleic acid-binding protein